jgi:hypothetical protein
MNVSNSVMLGLSSVVELLGIAAVAVVLVWLQGLSYKRWRHGRFRKRSELPLDELYDRHFAGTAVSREGFTELWGFAAETLELPAERLRPSDRFKKELKFGLLRHDPELTSLRSAMNRTSRRANLELDLKKIRTLADYIEAFGSEETGVWIQPAMERQKHE